MALQIGDPAPDFSLPDQQGQPVALKDFRGQRVVIYFYPKERLTPHFTISVSVIDWDHYNVLWSSTPINRFIYLTI